MMADLSDASRLREHYQGLYARFGADHRAVQWSSRETQRARFQVLGEYVGNTSSVIDVGSGLGDFLDHLRTFGFCGKYRGLELVPEFVHYANARFADDADASFEEQNILDGSASQADVVVASGLFNNTLSDNWNFMLEVLASMLLAARQRVVFNALSTYVDYRDPDLYYVDPLALFDHVKRNLTPRVTLRHDYLVKPGSIPFEFVMVLHK
jgi:SAM-dependent methyltransferase